MKKIYQRSFPDINLLDENTTIVEKEFDGYIYLSSLGQFFRPDINSFENLSSSYLVDDKTLTQTLKNKIKFNKKAICGISWKSTNTKLGSQKNLTLEEMISIFNLDINFVNLQYGDINFELDNIKNNFGIQILNLDTLDLFNDIDGLASLIDACDLIITSSNVTAHIAGAIGKKTYLIAPFGLGKIWYWDQADGQNLWYPSVHVINQDTPENIDLPLQKVLKFIGGE